MSEDLRKLAEELVEKQEYHVVVGYPRIKLLAADYLRSLDKLAEAEIALRAPALKRFWTKVEKTDECWNWTASRNKDGYGQFKVQGSNLSLAHRFAYEQLVGPIPEGLTIDHLCRNRACVRPAHLEAVPMEENHRRGRPGRFGGRQKQPYCKRGHPMDGPGSDVRISGTTRNCRICNRMRNREIREAARAALSPQEPSE